jgi:hypothetical protein
VLEHVMAEYLEARPELTYGAAGVVYELSGSLTAIAGDPQH